MNPTQARREQQLRQLVAEGVPLHTLGKSGHWIIGSLHIYTATGRWFSGTTGKRGRLSSHPIRQIVEREYCPAHVKTGAGPGVQSKELRVYMAPRHGFEPRFTAPKAAVLPLDDRGAREEGAIAIQFNRVKRQAPDRERSPVCVRSPVKGRFI